MWHDSSDASEVDSLHIHIDTKETPPPRRICTRCVEAGPLAHGSWWGNIINRKTPPGRGFFRSTYAHTYGMCIACRNWHYQLLVLEPRTRRAPAHALVHFLPAVPSYQRRPSSPRMREGNVRFPSNLHGVRRPARPTSRWAPKAHRMMGKTQWRHRERSFGTNVPVLDKQRDNFPLLSADVNKNVVVERFLN